MLNLRTDLRVKKKKSDKPIEVNNLNIKQAFFCTIPNWVLLFVNLRTDLSVKKKKKELLFSHKSGGRIESSPSGCPEAECTRRFHCSGKPAATQG
jgi:hypothetical protein